MATGTSPITRLTRTTKGCPAKRREPRRSPSLGRPELLCKLNQVEEFRNNYSNQFYKALNQTEIVHCRIGGGRTCDPETFTSDPGPSSPLLDNDVGGCQQGNQVINQQSESQSYLSFKHFFI